jgi:hypothetical protein
MATTPVQIEAPSGLTLTLELYPHGSDTIANGEGDTLTEETNRHGVYSASVTESLTGLHHAIVVDVSNNSIATYHVDLADTTAIHYAGDIAASVQSGVTLADSEDVYHALIEYTFDSPNDEYTVTWFKNGARVTSGITVPTMQVIKRADGTDLVASTPMTQIGSSGSYKYDEATNVIDADESYLAVTSATIDSGGRSFACLVSRSS